MPVNTSNRNGVAIISIDQPPVNGLDVTTRRGILQAVNAALADASVTALVIAGGARVFSAGADIEEFATGINGPVLSEPTLPALIEHIEKLPKPVVAAINGICMGGGLELALGCHYRIAAANARFALPEVQLGILPGAGGTQRLPRAIGVSEALAMITTGETIDTARAVSLGLATTTADDVMTAAVEQARQAARDGSWPRLRDHQAALPAGQSADAYFSARLAALKKPGLAVRRCVDAVRMAVEVPFDQAVAREFAMFKELVVTPESKALQYAFFGERAAARIDGVARDSSGRRIERVAVIGAGTMGGGIAMCAANAGLPVVLIDQTAEAVARGVEKIRSNYANTVKKGRMSAQAMEQRMALISTATQLSAVADADLIIEAIFEDMAVKKSTFKELDAIAKPGAVLASNTSTLNLDEIAAATRRPEDVVGLHFFSPANVMRLLEIVRGARTTPEVLSTAMSFSKRISKIGVVAGVCDGFIGNRMFEEYLRQAYFLMDEGVTPIQVDTAMENFGFAMGPIAVMDMAGQDIGWAIRKRRAADKSQRVYSRVPDLVCELGRFGQKSGAGFYKYDPVTRARMVDPEIEAMIGSHARELGIKPRAISAAEIVDRCVLALFAEGSALLREGIAQRASDIDVVWLNGYGFPNHRGGPMYHAANLGGAAVNARLAEFRRGYHGECWPESINPGVGDKS
jgi:3-hydroxyacyl-CoA dehydrogenase